MDLVELVIGLYESSKELVDEIKIRLPAMDAIDRMKEIRSGGYEDELGYFFGPGQASCRIRPVR